MRFCDPKKLGLLLFIFGGLFCSWAEPFSLTLDEAVSRALDQSIDLQKRTIDLELAQYRVEHLWAGLFPSFSLGGGLTLLPATPLFTEPGFSYSGNSLSYSVSLGMNFQFRAGIPYTMQLTELAYREGLFDYESARRRLEIDVAKIFYGLLARRENIINLEETLVLAERQFEKNTIARSNGLMGELPWLQSRLGVETARYNLSTEQGAYQNSLNDFLTTLGLDRNIDLVLEGEIVTVPFAHDPEALILEYLPKRPDIVSQRQIIERYELVEKQSYWNSRAPSLGLSVSWEGGPERNSGLTGKFTDSLSGRLSLSVPIDSWIPGTSASTTLRASGADMEKARLDLINTETTAKASIRSLAGNLRNSWESIEIARLRVEIAERTYELSEMGFQNGTVESLSMETTRKDLADAQYRLLQGEQAYLVTMLDLAAALNMDWETLIRSGK